MGCTLKQRQCCCHPRISFPQDQCPEVREAWEGECRKEVTPQPLPLLPFHPCLTSETHFFLVPTLYLPSDFWMFKRAEASGKQGKPGSGCPRAQSPWEELRVC